VLRMLFHLEAQVDDVCANLLKILKILLNFVNFGENVVTVSLAPTSFPSPSLFFFFPKPNPLKSDNG